MQNLSREQARLEEARIKNVPWRKWGPYLSERQWGTVRENMNPGIEAWNEVTHDQSRSRAYLSGEDGIAGFCDDRMLLCFALALWNGKDPIIKERLYGLTNSEGNHGEDVKEYYFYLDSTPSHSYAKMLYKYPQAAFPYEQVRAENGRRSREEFEYELMDTGVFDDNRYWDVYVEFAKADPEDIQIRITAVNRGPEAAPLQILPHLWFRNTWWADARAPRPELEASHHNRCAVIVARHHDLGTRYLYCDHAGALLFTDNETNHLRLWGQANPTTYQKDGINDFVVTGRGNAVNPGRKGTKSAAVYPVTVGPGESATVRLRLTPRAPGELPEPFGPSYEQIFEERRRETDDFYHRLFPDKLSDDAKNVIRQGYSGLLWTKQAYVYDLEKWLGERGVTRDTGDGGRNKHWFHMYSADIISMPDKWEYPWFAAWDLAFHCVALAAVDPSFAQNQLDLMLLERYQHPNGQLPAYEWNFDDVNPPVHAWAALYNYRMNRVALGPEALISLKRTFNMLVANFTWWLNRKDRDGRNLFEGGFLGLDNIGVFDRSSPLPTGGYLEQADGTTWMAFYCQTMLQIALELAVHDPVRQEMAAKFYEHFLWIAGAMDRVGPHQDELWDEEDGFFYDVLRLPGDQAVRLKVRSMVGLLSICASTVFPPEVERLPLFLQRVRDFTRRHPDLVANIVSPGRVGQGGRHLLSLLNDEKLRRVLRYMLDEDEFLSPFGIRALSRFHRDNPYTFSVGRDVYRVDYEPAESTSGLFGGNSNWRGPIWFPVNALLIRGLLNLYAFYGNDFTVECPTGSGKRMNLFEVAREIAERLARPFLRDEQGARPVHGGAGKFQSDPHWRDLILFYEYFHGDNGAGLGASHQTGWTGLVAALIQLFGSMDPAHILARGVPGAFEDSAAGGR